MMKKFIYIIGIITFLSGCANDVALPETEGERVPILFSAGGTGISTDTQAQTKTTGDAFPNEGKVAIVATTSTSTATPTDWTELYLNHVEATAAAEDANGKHSITLAKTEYWPFNPDEKLVFVSYSPRGIQQTSGNKMSLNIQQKDGMEDIVYTTPTAPLNKEAGTADLGKFQHALTKVRIIVKAIDEAGNPTTAKQFEVTGIKVKTKATSATFNLATSVLTTTLANDFAPYTLLSTATALDKTEGVTAELNILPGNEENTYIGLTLKDDVLSYGKDGNDSSKDDFGYKLADFTPNENTKPLTFEAGKITTLTFNIKITNVQDNTIILKGDLKDWECQGNFEVGIE